MKRRIGLCALMLGLSTLCAVHASPSAQGEGPKPNFVFILIDDFGWKDAGFMGSTFYETPRMDALAREGMVFLNAYANAPNCAPTRACLLTGQYTPRHGVYTVNNAERGEAHKRMLIPVENKKVLDPKMVTLAEALKIEGYASASVGKWHLGEGPATGPAGQGFDVNIGGNRAGYPKSYFSPYKIRNLEDGPEGEYLTDRLTDEALRFIESNRHRPFFLYLSHYAVHTPIQAPKELEEKFKKKRCDSDHNRPDYAAMIERVDAGIGRVMDKLRQLRLEERTVVLLFSDNGGHGPVTSMNPLRGAKGMLYEGGIRVPMVVRWPGKIPSGSVCETPVIGADFFPTLLDLAGAAIPEGYPVDGESLVPLLLEEGELERDAIFWHFPAYLEAARGSDQDWRTTPAGAVRMGDWKLLEFFEDGRIELYNLKEDVGERNNLALSLPERAKELHQVMRAWRRSVKAPVPVERNPEYDPSR